MNKQQFQLATGLSAAMTDVWYEPVEQAMMEGGIAHPRDVAAFLATAGHESGGFRFMAEVWGPTKTQAGYSGRAELGNTKPEAIAYASAAGFPDVGRFYRGYGLIQVTGYDNLARAGDALGLDLRRHPELAAVPRNSARVSVRWWVDNKASAVAMTGDFLALSRLVNMGRTTTDRMPNGWEDRQARYNRAIKVLE